MSDNFIKAKNEELSSYDNYEDYLKKLKTLSKSGVAVLNAPTTEQFERAGDYEKALNSYLKSQEVNGTILTSGKNGGALIADGKPWYMYDYNALAGDYQKALSDYKKLTGKDYEHMEEYNNFLKNDFTSESKSASTQKESYDAEHSKNAVDSVEQVTEKQSTNGYQDTLKQMAGQFEAAKTEQLKANEDAYNEAIRLAEQNRQKGIVEANTNYQLALAGYGKNAESLNRMGLSGSGYSDYVGGAAYAANRGESAVVNGTAEKEKQYALYQKALADASAGAAYASNMGNYYNALAQMQYNSEENELDRNYRTKEALKNRDYESKKLEEEREYALQLAQKQKAEEQNANYSYLLNSLSDEGFDFKEAANALKTGSISQTQYDSLKADYNAEIAKIDLSKYTAQDALSIVSGVKSEATKYGWIDEKTLSHLTERYNTLFSSGKKENTYESITETQSTLQMANNLLGGSGLTIELDKRGNAKIVDVDDERNETYDWRDFGKYFNDPFNEEQRRYIANIQDLALGGEIPIGSFINANLGVNIKGQDESIYVYVGDGKFVNVSGVLGNRAYVANNMFVPEGYKQLELEIKKK